MLTLLFVKPSFWGVTGGPQQLLVSIPEAQYKEGIPFSVVFFRIVGLSLTGHLWSRVLPVVRGPACSPLTGQGEYSFTKTTWIEVANGGAEGCDSPTENSSPQRINRQPLQDVTTVTTWEQNNVLIKSPGLGL